MNLSLIAIDNKSARWVNEVFDDYARKIHNRFKLNSLLVPAVKRSKKISIDQINAMESDKLLQAANHCDRLIILDGGGKTYDSIDFSKQIQRLIENYQHTAFLVGGPNGHHDQCKEQAHETWSLSALTLPHPLVRVVFAEQCFRAWSLITGHPYHK